MYEHPQEDRPRDSLGRPKRKLRYPNRRFTKLSDDAADTLDEMAIVRNTKPATLIRRAIMKDIYIYKNRKQKGNQDEQEE